MIAFFVALQLITAPLSAASPAEGPPTIDVATLPSGILVKFPVDSLPVFVLRRSSDELAVLRKTHATAQGGEEFCHDCDAITRSIDPEVLVVSGYNPASGCELIYVASKATDRSGYAVGGRGGFVDKCTQTEYDLSGRKLRGPESSPDELAIPMHRYVGTQLQILRRSEAGL